MPAIDLTRLRKQAARLADFFFLPDEFMKHLREILEFYVNYTLRTVENVTGLKPQNLPHAPRCLNSNSKRTASQSRRESTLRARTRRPALG